MAYEMKSDVQHPAYSDSIRRILKLIDEDRYRFINIAKLLEELSIFGYGFNLLYTIPWKPNVKVLVAESKYDHIISFELMNGEYAKIFIPEPGTDKRLNIVVSDRCSNILRILEDILTDPDGFLRRVLQISYAYLVNLMSIDGRDLDFYVSDIERIENLYLSIFGEAIEIDPELNDKVSSVLKSWKALLDIQSTAKLNKSVVDRFIRRGNRFIEVKAELGNGLTTRFNISMYRQGGRRVVVVNASFMGDVPVATFEFTYIADEKWMGRISTNLMTPCMACFDELIQSMEMMRTLLNNIDAVIEIADTVTRMLDSMGESDVEFHSEEELDEYIDELEGELRYEIEKVGNVHRITQLKPGEGVRIELIHRYGKKRKYSTRDITIDAEAGRLLYSVTVPRKKISIYMDAYNQDGGVYTTISSNFIYDLIDRDDITTITGALKLAKPSNLGRLIQRLYGIVRKMIGLVKP